MSDTNKGIFEFATYGPTLRDQFAMAALQGMLAANDTYEPKEYANDAYAIADAMLEAREVE